MKVSRFFNPSQKFALNIFYGNKCQICGDDLQIGWHADHVIPWSKGGKTDVLNGQSLCRTCNLKKGNTIMDDLREWQKKCSNEIKSINGVGKDFLCVATPGAGKTRMALFVIRDAMATGSINRIVIVVPSTNLKRQWAEVALDFGIRLLDDWTNDNVRTTGGIEPSDIDGVCLTYQQVGRQPDLFRLSTARSRTFVVFDEIHHAGEDESGAKNLVWGNALKEAFEPAQFRLALSGTPFRSDGFKIPFITYEETHDGYKCVPDFNYGYGEALKDGVCRTLLFPKYDGIMEWSFNDTIKAAKFSDSLDRRDESLRLRTSLDHLGDTFENMIKNAHKKLLEIRSDDQPNAAGLITTMNEIHARNIARSVMKHIGIEPIVVVSSDAESHGRIEHFKTSGEPWMISIRMVSEGIDIPRLRVGVYATNIVQELYFRQFIGRFVRGGSNDCAWIFIPEDKRIVDMAIAIQEIRDHVIENEVDEGKERKGGDRPEQVDRFIPITSNGFENGIICNALSYGQTIKDKVDFLKKEYPNMSESALYQICGAPKEMLQKIIGGDQQHMLQTGKQLKKPSDERKELSKVVNKLVSIINVKTGMEYKDIHYNYWISKGGKTKNQMTNDDLKAKADILRSVIRSL